MESSLQHKDRRKHKIEIQAWAKSRTKTKQRKILVVLFSQVPEDISCFGFVWILSLCLCRSSEAGLTQLMSSTTEIRTLRMIGGQSSSSNLRKKIPQPHMTRIELQLFIYLDLYDELR